MQISNNFQIAGLQKTSLIDYPKKISAILFTQGCNFRCRYCHNPELIPFNQGMIFNITENDVLNFLKSRKHKIEALCITGGEPLLQSGLKEFIQKVKKMKYKVKLDTNGSNFELLKNLIEEKLVDYIAMDYKAHFDLFGTITQVPESMFKEISKTKDYLINSKLKYEFRITILPKFFNDDDILKLAQELKGAKLVYLQNFHDNGKLLDESLAGELGFTINKLKDFQKIMKKYVKKCGIRD
ncbi:MAG TPA: anaerobic ribonucleoside-triphosphate reductase activating protein [bacterium]|nr:anaerobic ribonucleoside-triphosphate reductase activating protein [bacterium]HOG38572.1 anaerobic ribonucleoside-triphosphate reductase activating protein [bacterium]HQI03426.1 anaerobic ribonucleoside-triphosphate reductase activating protein [bacterium]